MRDDEALARVRALCQGWRPDTAYSTDYVAQQAGVTEAQARTALLALEREGGLWMVLGPLGESADFGVAWTLPGAPGDIDLAPDER